MPQATILESFGCDRTPPEENDVTSDAEEGNTTALATDASATATADATQPGDHYAFTKGDLWLGCTAEALQKQFQNEEYCIPPGSKEDTYIWRVGRLVGSDPKTAKYYRCMIPDDNGKCCTHGRNRGLVTYTPGNHSNLKQQHLFKHHSHHYDEYKCTSAKSLQAAKTGNSGGHYTARHTTARTLLKLKILFVLMCCFNYLHPHFARSPIYDQFMDEACPMHSAPHPYMFGRICTVIKLYQQQKIMEHLHSAHQLYGRQPFASTSVDLWSSKHSNMGFAAMDVQFGDPTSASIRSYTLAVKHIPGAHTHDTLVSLVEAVSESFGFESVLAWLLVAVIDGGSNVRLAMEVLNLIIIYCYTHRLHLSVKRALGQYGQPSINKLVAKLLTKIRALIGHFTRSPKNTSLLLKLQKGKMPRPLKLLQDMVVRWLATANALKRLLTLRNFIREFFSEHDHDFAHQLDPQEWKAVQGILAVIDFGRRISTMLQTESLSVIAVGLVWIRLFANHCRNVKQQPTMNDPSRVEAVEHQSLHPRAKSVAQALEADASQRFSNDTITSIERMAFIADPRTKHFPAILNLSPSDQLEAKKQFSKLLYRIQRHMPPPQGQEQGEPEHHGAEQDAFDAALLALDEVVGAPAGAGEAQEEETHPALLKYLDSVPPVPLSTPNFDPLVWHQRRRATSEVLYLGCILLLGLALTSARNERTFSVAGHVLDELSAQLSPEMLECLILIKRNWHLLLHTVEKTVTTRNSKGEPMAVKVQKEEVNWKPLLELYIDMYGRNPTAEAEKRQKRQREAQEADLPEEGPAEPEEGAAGPDVASGSESNSSDDGDVRAPPETRAQKAQADKEARKKRLAEMAATLPQASVCIQMDAALWPGHNASFTEGVEEVFLQEAEDDDDDDSIPLGVLYEQGQLLDDNGNWSGGAKAALDQYQHETMVDTSGSELDLSIVDPEFGCD